jgi:soluble lytic murein transglycosylase
MMTPMKRRSYYLAGWAIVVLVLGSACTMGTPEPPTATATMTQTPSPTNTPIPSPTPTPAVNIFLEAAQRAEFNGDWERALAGYDQAAAFALDPSEIVQAELGRGRSLIAAGSLSEAVQSLSAFLALDLGEGAVEAYLLRGDAYEQLGEYQTAANDFSTAAGLVELPLQDWILKRAGDAWSYAGQLENANEAYKQALDVLYPTNDYDLETKYARTLDRLDQKDAALERYRAIQATYEEPFIQAQMDYLIGKLLQWQGQSEEANTAFLDAVVNYPQTLDAYSSLQALLNSNVPVNDLAKGIVYFYADEYLAAQSAFERYILSDPESHAGIVHHYLALIYRSQGDYEGAIGEWDLLIATHPGDENIPLAWEQQVRTLWAYMDQYQAAWELSRAFYELDREHPRAPDFLFTAAAIAEMGDNLQLAAEWWIELSDAYPGYERAFEARFKGGISYFRLGENAPALSAFQAARELAVSPAEKAASQLWIGKTYVALGEVEQAQSAWGLAVAADPGGYYGLRADDLLQGRAPFTRLGDAAFSEDLGALRQVGEEWLRQTFNLPATENLSELGPELAAHPRALRGNMFWEIGAYARAKIEFNALRDEIQGDPSAMFRLMNHLVDLGLYQPAIYLSAEILAMAGVQDLPADQAPWYISTIRFGDYYGDLILNEAANANFDGLFVLAVTRQESLFEGFATSYAAARGLMQIIPSTGEYIASQAGWPADFTIDDLYRPIVSVHYGVRYLTEQRELFDGDLYATLAAYNAGPGNSLAWVSQAQGDPDLFLEIVRIQQPQDYIRSIYWAYRQYQFLYTSAPG